MKEQVLSTMKSISIDYYTSGDSNQNYHKKEICQYCIKRREGRTVQKKAEKVISNILMGFTVVVEDESIFIHDALVRRMWVPEGKRPIVITTGSHQKTHVFGALSIDGKQLFIQYSAFDRFTFLAYLKKLQNKFHKVILFLDRAAQHYRSMVVKKYFEKNKDILEVKWFPKSCPEFNQ